MLTILPPPWRRITGTTPRRARARPAGPPGRRAPPCLTSKRRERGRDEVRVLRGVERGGDLPENLAPALAPLQSRPPLLAVGEAVVAPERGVGGERADVRR